MIVEFQKNPSGVYELRDMIGNPVLNLSGEQKSAIYLRASEACMKCPLDCIGMGDISEDNEMLNIDGEPVLLEDCMASYLAIKVEV